MTIKNRRPAVYEDPQMNLTPLIDVVFVILIMFIVVAPFLELERIELAAKKEGASFSSNNIPLQIHVFADNSITCNRLPVTASELVGLLKKEKMRNPDACPHLYHDVKASFGTYQSIKNAVEEAGFSQMDLILQME